jgi:alpha-N-arabinofuranosidase
MIRTPTYYAFQMYIPFQDATFVPLDLGDVPQYALGDYAVPQVSASAALTKDGRLVVALVNLSASDAIDIKTKVDGFAAGTATGTVLTGSTIDAHNTFDKPDTVKPAPLAVGFKGGSMSVKLPARSVSVITLNR